MMAGEEDIPVGRILVERRLIGRARLQVVGSDELHVVARSPLLVVGASAHWGGARGQQHECEGDRENANRREKTLLLHQSFLPYCLVFLPCVQTRERQQE